MVTLTNQPDVHKAVSELVEGSERKQAGAHSPRLPQGQFPPLCLYLHPVDSAVRPCSIGWPPWTCPSAAAAPALGLPVPWASCGVAGVPQHPAGPRRPVHGTTSKALPQQGWRRGQRTGLRHCRPSSCTASLSAQWGARHGPDAQECLVAVCAALYLRPVLGAQDKVPRPPPDELAALAELHAARKVYYAQANLENRKVGLHMQVPCISTAGPACLPSALCRALPAA